MTSPINNRYDFVFLFDVKDGNPNGDPDQANMPRVDAETQDGLVSDVCIKRKVRNYVQLKHGLKPGYDIFIRQKNILNDIIEGATGDGIDERQKSLSERFYDIRTFGAVLATGDSGAGTVRGPAQFTFSRSEDRVFQAEHSITRCAVTTKEDAKKQESREFASTFGRKATIPYALYRMHGFISAVDARKSGFSEEDLSLLWEALLNAFEHDRSAARGEMAARALIVFKHDSHLGNARASELLGRVKVSKQESVEIPRAWEDYRVEINEKDLPAGITFERKL